MNNLFLESNRLCYFWPQLTLNHEGTAFLIRHTCWQSWEVASGHQFLPIVFLWTSLAFSYGQIPWAELCCHIWAYLQLQWVRGRPRGARPLALYEVCFLNFGVNLWRANSVFHTTYTWRRLTHKLKFNVVSGDEENPRLGMKVFVSPFCLQVRQTCTFRQQQGMRAGEHNTPERLGSRTVQSDLHH